MPGWVVNRVPGYWMYETSGVLAPVVLKFLRTEEALDVDEIGILRVYLRQWIAGDFRGPDAERLRSGISDLTTRADLVAWLDEAMHAGIDPF